MTDSPEAFEVEDRWVERFLDRGGLEIDRLDSFEGLLASDPTRAIGLLSRLGRGELGSAFIERLAFLTINLWSAGFFDPASAAAWPDELRARFHDVQSTTTEPFAIDAGPEGRALSEVMRSDPSAARVSLKQIAEAEEKSEPLRVFAGSALARLFLCRASFQGDEANMTDAAHDAFFDVLDGPDRFSR